MSLYVIPLRLALGGCRLYHALYMYGCFYNLYLQIAEDKINVTGRREGELCRRLSTVLIYSLEENFSESQIHRNHKHLNASKAYRIADKQKKSTPSVGIEPTTTRLRVVRSTD